MKFRRGYTEDPEVNLIPLIDVLLVVLIFLAVSTTYARFAELRIDLPDATPRPSGTPPPEVHVAISADGRFAMDRQTIPVTDSGAIVDLLRPHAVHDPRTLLVIDADAQAPHQSVVTVMDAARSAGLTHLSFATQHRAHGHP